MSNSLGSNPGVLIGQRALETTLEEGPFLRNVVADFSSESALYNQAINVKLPSAFGAAASYDPVNGYIAADANAVDIPLVINRHVHVTYGFNDQERSKTNISLIETFAANAAQAIMLAMVTDLFGLVNAANFPNASVAGIGLFDRSAVLAAGNRLSIRKVPRGGRFMVFDSPRAKSLLEDTVIVANAGSPSDAVRSGNLGKIHGFDTFEYPQFTAGSGAGGSANCYGIAAVPEALIIATRLPPPPEKADFPGSIQIITEPTSGLSLQYRSWYNPGLGKEFRSYTLMFGVAAGNPAALERLTVSAD